MKLHLWKILVNNKYMYINISREKTAKGNYRECHKIMTMCLWSILTWITRYYNIIWTTRFVLWISNETTDKHVYHLPYRMAQPAPQPCVIRLLWKVDYDDESQGVVSVVGWGGFRDKRAHSSRARRTMLNQ